MMKSKIAAVALFAVTAAGVALFPHARSVGAHTPAPPPAVSLTGDRPRVEVVFALDTTGSMGGLIAAAKEKIWSIATTMASAQPAPEVRIGLVAYRDRGDRYVTRVADLSSDLDSMYATLMEFQAAGGGDGPESVNAALYDAVHQMSWSADQDTYRVIFLVGDAPPHMDYPDEMRYPQILELAAARDIVVNTVRAGRQPGTAAAWQRIAALGAGRYLEVGQSGSAVAIATPFDEQLAALAARLDDTRLYYGSEAEKADKRRKVAAASKLREEATLATQARRAAFNASESGAVNLIGEGELVDDVASGRVELGDIEADALPESLQAMPPAEQQALIDEAAEQRTVLKQQIKELARQRDRYLEREVASRGGAESSLDNQIHDAVREQAAAKGLRYGATPSY